MKQPVNALAALPVALVVATSALTACSVAGGAEGDTEVITVGYQSKTINTVTAGTLLRERGYFEQRLDALGKQTGKTYRVDWQDYDTGAPITAQMLAGKIDIGSMGDYPLLINGSRAGTDEHGTEMVSVTGYNPHGALNGVVVAPNSDVKTLTDLEGGDISASVGSAGHGTLVQALDAAGLDPEHDVTVENQDPSVGAAALKAGSVDAVAQFVAWPGLLAFQDQDRLVYDGGRLDLPTLHGVVVRKEFVSQDEDVVDAFLQAQLDATDYLHQHPVEAAEAVAKETGLPPEVVYLYNGRNGVSTFDPTIKPEQVDALHHDAPFLKSIGVLTDPLDLDAFVDDSLVRQAYEEHGDGSYEKAVGSLANAAAIGGRDAVCKRQVKDPGTAGEVWVAGEDDTRPVADPVCLLRTVNQVTRDGGTVRAAYVPDALTGTRWFADRMVWLRDGQRLYPFATQENADEFAKDHTGAKPVSWNAALEVAG